MHVPEGPPPQDFISKKSYNKIKMTITEKSNFASTQKPIWEADFKCGSVLVQILFYRDPGKLKSVSLRKMPRPFEAILSGFKCEDN